jgi:molecular chaperone DnaK (HSP70)
MCAQDDAFCGACGKACASLQLESQTPVVVAGHHAPELVFSLTNPTCATLSVNSWQGPEWLKWSTKPEGTIPPGGIAKYFATAATRKLERPMTGQVEIETNAGGVATMLMAISPNPELKPATGEIDLWLDGSPDTRQLNLKAFPAAGSLRIVALHGDPMKPWFRVIPPTGPFVTSPDKPAELTVEVDPDRFANSPADAPGNRRSVQVGVDYQGPHGVTTIQMALVFAVRSRPQLTWEGENAQPARLVAMARQTLVFSFANRSREDGGLRNIPLRLDEVSLTAPDGVECSIRRLSPLPAEVPGGERSLLSFELDLAGVAPALYHFKLEVHSNGPQPVRVWDAVPILVDPVKEFDGILAIDFGTSNTCCAVLESDGEVEDMPVDEERYTCPTLVRYLDLSGTVPEIETGLRVKRLAAVDDAVAASKLDRLKQMLGEVTCLLPVRPKNARFFAQREARDAAADYLRHLRTIVEWRRKAVFPDIMLTHPAVSSLRQYRNLRLAVEQAFGKNTRIQFLQEPIAALIPFFAHMAEFVDAPSYTVAAFDLGGGTTDITLVRVEHIRTGLRLEIRPEIVASWGEKFGGEDLTDVLTKELTSRVQQILENEKPGYRLAARQVKGAADPDFLLNESALREGAERLKAGLSEEKDPEREPFRRLLLRVIPPDPDSPPEDYSVEATRLSEAGPAPLDAFFLTMARASIERLAARLKQSAGVLGSLDHIHLSGKTTFLPVVMDVLKTQFTAQIHRAGDPKECVVRGACLARAMGRLGRSRRLVLPPETRRTTSSIGLMDENGCFAPVIPLDRPIPDEGLVMERSEAWSGDGPVVLWENLGFEKERVRADGSRNPLLQKLGTWQPQGKPIKPDAVYGLKLRLSCDFNLEAELTGPEGHTIPLRQRAGQ